MDTLIEELMIEEDNGFKSKGHMYQDHLGFDTIGFGTLLPLSKEECIMLLEHRFSKIKQTTVALLASRIGEQDERVWQILYLMAYQLGAPRLLKFEKMIDAITKKDYQRAKEEALDSKWATQTPQRAIRVANKFNKLIKE